jgi:hypothetical protein
MDVRHDYVDPDNCSDPAPLRMEPVRRGSVKRLLSWITWPLVQFICALALSLLAFHWHSYNWIIWFDGALVGNTGFNLLLEWIER